LLNALIWHSSTGNANADMCLYMPNKLFDQIRFVVFFISGILTIHLNDSE